jgi:hypothetical protein
MSPSEMPDSGVTEFRPSWPDNAPRELRGFEDDGSSCGGELSFPSDASVASGLNGGGKAAIWFVGQQWIS